MKRENYIFTFNLTTTRFFIPANRIKQWLRNGRSACHVSIQTASGPLLVNFNRLATPFSVEREI